MSDLNLDDSNPMAALLASAPKEPTILDKIYQEKQLGQANQPKEEEKDLNIGLSVRQPSYTSLQGTVVVKGGDADSAKKNQIQDDDPVVVFDGHSDNESDNEPIGLGVRQPSFVSLHGQIIPKGADSLADLHPVIEEVPIEAPEEVPEDDEDEDDPQVKIVKRLQAKNANRWAEIGYEPPQDLIPLVRAKSQAQMQGQGLTRNGYLSTSLTKFYMNTDDNKGGKGGSKALPTLTETISEADETKNASPTKKEAPQSNNANLYGIPGLNSQDLNQKAVPTPTRRKRSGSFGMKLGEASASMERMHLIIPEEEDKKLNHLANTIPEDVPEEKDEDNKEQDQDDEKDQQEEEEEEPVQQKPKPKRRQRRQVRAKRNVIRKKVQEIVPQDEDEEEEEIGEQIEDDDEDYSVEPLYGHLGEIVTEGPDSPVYQTLLSGENPPSIAIPVVKVALRKYLRICNENEWEQEASFISNLIEELPQTMPRKSLQEPRRQRVSLGAGATLQRRPRTQSVKATRSNYTRHHDYSDNASVSSTSSNCNSRMQRALAKLDAEYEQEAQTLDEYWHSDAVAATYARTST